MLFGCGWRPPELQQTAGANLLPALYPIGRLVRAATVQRSIFVWRAWAVRLPVAEICLPWRRLMGMWSLYRSSRRRPGGEARYRRNWGCQQMTLRGIRRQVCAFSPRRWSNTANWCPISASGFLIRAGFDWKCNFFFNFSRKTWFSG